MADDLSLAQILAGLAEDIAREVRRALYERGWAASDCETVEEFTRDAALARLRALPADGVHFDPATGNWIGRHTIITAAKSEKLARRALSGAVKLTAEAWPPRDAERPVTQPLPLEGDTK